ncbi:ABC transporter permease [Micrococcus terreus]|uniref:ABC transporter permease n=1 Tax=Micrococcus terreus TaxID=574650 RepID=UPI0034038F80
MRNSVHAEAIRLSATPNFPRFLLAGLAAALFLTGGLTVLGPEHMNPPMPGPDVPEGVHGLLGLLVLTAPIPVLMGASAMTTEFAHRTIIPTVLFQPRRHYVVLAKLAVMVVAGLVYGLVVAIGAVLGVFGGAWIARMDVAVPVLEVSVLALRIGLSMAFYTVIGVGIGALIPRPQAALIVIVGWFYLLESMLSAIPGIQSAYPWLPGGAASAITGQNFVLDAIASATGGGGVHLLPAAAGMAILLAYAFMASLLALATTLRNDIR